MDINHDNPDAGHHVNDSISSPSLWQSLSELQLLSQCRDLVKQTYCSLWSIFIENEM